jgi:hypothetical protein
MMLAYYTLLTATVRRRPWLALRALALSISYVPTFLRRRAPLSPKEFARWRRVRDEYQREYLQRTGRWRWYHERFPAAG